MYVSVKEFKKNYVPSLSERDIFRLAREGALVCIYSGSRLKINALASVEKLNSYTETKPTHKPKEEHTEVDKPRSKLLQRNPKYRGKLPDKLRNKKTTLMVVKEVNKWKSY